MYKAKVETAAAKRLSWAGINQTQNNHEINVINPPLNK